MVRLPPKKSKQKQVVIDFGSIESARSSAPPTYDYDSWLEEGIKQEEQGERYQFGNKATRHYSNAVVCFSLAASFVANDFDSRYNAARVLYRLASDHLPLREAYDALVKAIVGYRDAVRVGHDNVMATIDGLFNLAQADVALYEMLEDSAVAGVAEETGLEAAKDARSLFEQVEALQRGEMEKVFGSGGAQDEGELQEDPGTGQEVQATETTIVTPQLVLDTLLASISLDTSLYPTLDHDPASQAQLLESATATFGRAVALRNQYLTDCPPEVDVEMTLAHFSILSASSPPQATQVLEHALASRQTPSPSLLSLYADHLVESLPLTQPFDVVGPRLERALSTYQTVQSLLSNRLSPPKDVPSFQIPLLLSSNLVAQSTIHLVSYHLVEHLSRSPTANAPSSSERQQHLVTAHALVLESISALQSGTSLTPSTTNSPGLLRPLTVVRSPASHEPRQNVSTVVALRLAYFSLVRIRLWSLASFASFSASNSDSKTQQQQQQEDEEVQNEKNRFWGVWNALTRDARNDDALKRRDVEWWIEEIEDDKVSQTVGRERAQREKEWWLSLIA